MKDLRKIILLWSLILVYVHCSGQSNSNNENKIQSINEALQIELLFDCFAPDSWNSLTYNSVDPKEPKFNLYLELLLKEYKKYPSGYLPNSSITKIVLVKDLKFKGQSRAAVPDPNRQQLFLSINGAFGISSQRYLSHVMHHELHHCTEYTLWKSMTYDWCEWIELNKGDFEYGDGGASAYAEYVNKGTDFYSPGNPYPGFINRYAMTGDEEDRAELMAFIMTDAERPMLESFLRKDAILKRKIDLLKSLLENFSNSCLQLPALNNDRN